MLGLHKSTVTCLAWSTNGAKLFSGDDKGRVVFTALELDKVQLQHSRTRTGTHTHTHTRKGMDAHRGTHTLYKHSKIQSITQQQRNLSQHNTAQRNATETQHNVPQQYTT